MDPTTLDLDSTPSDDPFLEAEDVTTARSALTPYEDLFELNKMPPAALGKTKKVCFKGVPENPSADRMERKRRVAEDKLASLFLPEEDDHEEERVTVKEVARGNVVKLTDPTKTAKSAQVTKSVVSKRSLGTAMVELNRYMKLLAERSEEVKQMNSCALRIISQITAKNMEILGMLDLVGNSTVKRDAIREENYRGQEEVAEEVRKAQDIEKKGLVEEISRLNEALRDSRSREMLYKTMCGELGSYVLDLYEDVLIPYANNRDIPPNRQLCDILCTGDMDVDKELSDKFRYAEDSYENFRKRVETDWLNERIWQSLKDSLEAFQQLAEVTKDRLFRDEECNT